MLGCVCQGPVPREQTPPLTGPFPKTHYGGQDSRLKVGETNPRHLIEKVAMKSVKVTSWQAGWKMAELQEEWKQKLERKILKTLSLCLPPANPCLYFSPCIITLVSVPTTFPAS